MNTNPKTNKKSAVELLEEGKTPQLLKYVPKGESPKVFLDLVKTHVMGVDKAGNARPNEDLMLFLYTAKRTGLDPLAKQIYAVYRWDSRIGREKMGIQVGIDGFRLVAQNSEEYGGQDDAEFLPADESAAVPVKAMVTVYRVNKKTGERMPTTATARWAEYAQKGKDGKLIGLWKTMPYSQLAKCAEALALRKAFPNKLSGIYTPEELPTESNILSDLSAPQKSISEPTVTHGQPIDLKPTEPEAIPGVENLPNPADMPKKQSMAPLAKSAVQSVVEMRGKVKTMQEKAREQDLLNKEANKNNDL